jgi:hypothetical protein
VACVVLATVSNVTGSPLEEATSLCCDQDCNPSVCGDVRQPAIKVLDYVVKGHILMGLEVRGTINCGQHVKYISCGHCSLTELWKDPPSNNYSELSQSTLLNLLRNWEQ